MLSKIMAKFALVHSRDPRIAQEAVTVLGEEACRIVPAARFEGEWVKRQHCGLEFTRYLVLYCNDAEALEEMSRTDRRAGVREAIATHPLFAQRRGDIEKDYEEELSRLLEELNRGGKKRVSTSAFEKVLSSMNATAKVVDDVVLAMAQHRHVDGVVAYLRTMHHGAFSPLGDVWKQGTLSVEAVFSALEERDREELAKRMYLAGAGNDTRYGVDMARIFMEYLTPRREPMGEGPSHIFSEEGVDVLLTDPKWLSLLAGQIISDAQFATLVQTSGGALAKCAYVLHGSRERLALLITSMKRLKRPLGERIIRRMVKCVVSSDDPLLAWLVAHSSKDDILLFAIGGWRGQKGALVPTREQMVWVESQFIDKKALGAYLKDGLTQYCSGWEVLPSAALDVVAGMAWACKLNSRCGEYTFSRLEGTGVELGVALEQFELMGEVASLDVICEALECLVRGSPTERVRTA
jgi:hypothetical protein